MKQLPESHSPNPSDWHMLNEMDGFMKLGMKSETCRVARKLLKTRLITTEIFIRTLTTMLAVAKRPKNWKSLVENAYKKLSKSDRQQASEIMLGYMTIQIGAAACLCRLTCGGFWTTYAERKN